MEHILKVDNLSFTYDKEKFVLKDVNMDFKLGVCYGIFGKSGAGKSTLLSLLSGLEITKYGHIYYGNKDLSKMNLDYYRSHHIGIIFQSFNLLIQLTAIENVILSIKINNPKVKKQKALDKAKKLLLQVGIGESLWNRRVLQLSGGEQQRVAIARALSYDAPIILADEPTGNLDSTTEEQIINLLLDIAHKNNKCVIIISHSKAVKESVDQIYHLIQGKLK